MNSVSSHNEFPFYAAKLPTCDAWALINMTSVPAIVDGSGISGVFSSDSYSVGVTFSNPNSFLGGYYGLMMTLEAMNDTYDPDLGLDNSLNFGYVKEPDRRLANIDNVNSDNDPNTWFVGYSGGFHYEIWGPVETGQFGPGIAFDSRVHVAAFCFSSDGRTGAANGGVTGGTYDLVPGSGGYGSSGATFHSAIGVRNSKRAASAYGTIVIPPSKGNGDKAFAYMENFYNIRGVSTPTAGIYDIEFSKEMNSNEYCVFMTGEYETNLDILFQQSGDPGEAINDVQEPALFLIRAGRKGDLKTRSKFRLESLRKIVDPVFLSNGGWTHSGYIPNKGLTEKIHFVVFGGKSYDAP